MFFFLEDTDRVEDAYRQCRQLLEKELEDVNQTVVEEIEKYLDTLEQVEDEFQLVQNLGEGLTFAFNKGPLIQAMERGDWILLDNINCARGDVIERLNSLAEADPTLTLYESASAHQYRRGNGIHKDFRLFVIANNNRKMANKLSSAWRNRCLIIRMQPLDNELLVDNVEQHDLAEIIKGELQGINGGQELTHTLLRLHASAKQLAFAKELQLITSYQLSFQNLKRSARILRTYITNSHDPVFALKPAIFRSYLDPILNNSGKIAVIEAFAQHLLNPELNKTSYSTLPMLTATGVNEDRHQSMAWYRTSQNLHDSIATIEECTLDLHLKIIGHHMNEETSGKEEFLDYALVLLDYLQPLLKFSPKHPSDDDLDSQASTIRSKAVFNDDPHQSRALRSDLKKWLIKVHHHLQSTRIILSLDEIDDVLSLLHLTVNECYKQILAFVEQTSFTDAQDRLLELHRLNSTINQLSSLTKKLQIVGEQTRSSMIINWSATIQTHLSALLVTETYMKWVSFSCQPTAKKDLHILSQTQEFLRQHNQNNGNIDENDDDNDNDLHSALKLINVHLQKVQSIPIVASADQRLDVILKLCQYLSIMKEDRFILLAAAKLELNVACKLTINLIIKPDFIEKMDEQQTLLNSSNLLASLNSAYFVHTILKAIYEEIASCKVQLDLIDGRYRHQEEMLVDDVDSIDEKITAIQMRIHRLLESQTSDIADIDTELTEANAEESKLNEAKTRHINALKNIEQLNEDIQTLFLPLRQTLQKFEENGWLQAIRDHGRRRQDYILSELFESIAHLYIKEYELNQVYSSSNVIDDERKQLKSDVLRQHLFNKVNFDDINTSRGRASLALMLLIYPTLFQQSILFIPLNDGTVNTCLETGNGIDVIFNSDLTSFLLVDKRSYNRYSTDHSGRASFNDKLVLRHFVLDQRTGSTSVDSMFLRLIARFESEVKQRSMDTEIDLERKLIVTDVDDEMMYFVVPCVIHQLVVKQSFSDDECPTIESKDVQQLDRDIQNWIHDQRQSGTIRAEQKLYQNGVENDIRRDIEFFLTIIDQTKAIVNQSFSPATTHVHELVKSVNRTRDVLGRQIIDKLERKLDETLRMCIPKEPMAKARTLAIVEAKQFRYPVLNQLKALLADPQTRFHAFISTVIDRLHMIQARLLQILLRHQANINEIDLYVRSHKISQLLITIITFLMENVDTFGLNISVPTFEETMRVFNDDLLKHAAYSQCKTVEQLTLDEIKDLTLFTRAELDVVILHANPSKAGSSPSTQPSMHLPRPTLLKKDAEETMLDRQNEELARVEQEFEQLRQLAKQNGLARIQYAIVMLLMELNEIKRNKTILNEVNLLHWRKSPKQLQRRIAVESVEHKKGDLFNIKRVKHEKSIEVTPEMIEKTKRSTTGAPCSADELQVVSTLVKSFSDEQRSESDSTLQFLIDYFHRQTYESMWTNVEKLIYELCLPNKNNNSAQSIIDRLKSLMAMFIFLDSTSLAEICKGLLQFCQEHADDQTDQFHLPAPRLKQLQTQTLENVIEQRSSQLQRFNPCDKSNLQSITSDEQDIQSYELIDIYPRLIRLYERHETLTRILHDQSNYQQSTGMQLAFLRLSDAIALLFPELSVLFMESLQFDNFHFEQIHQLDKYFSTEQFRLSIKELYEQRFILKSAAGEHLSLLAYDQPTGSELLIEAIQALVRQMVNTANSEDIHTHWFHQLTESNEYHAFFALELQSLLSKLFDGMQQNLSQFVKQLDSVSGTTMATDYLKFVDSMVNTIGQDLQRSKARKGIIEKELNNSTLTEGKRRDLEMELRQANGEIVRFEREYQTKLNTVAVGHIRRLLEVNRHLQMKGNYLPSQLMDKIENPPARATTSQQQRLTTSSEFYDYLFRSKVILLKSENTEFQQLRTRVNEFVEKVNKELTQAYADFHQALVWLTEDDDLRQIFQRFLSAYKLIHAQLLNSLRNWLDDMINQRNPYVDEIKKTIDQTCAFVAETIDIVQPITNAPQISSIVMTMETVQHNVEDLSRVAFQLEKFANDTRVVYSSKVLSMLLYHCSSLYARIAVFLVQLFKSQQSNPLVLAQLKTMSIIVNKQSVDWDVNMKKLLTLSGFRERPDQPGTSLPIDEYSLKEAHKRLSHDFSLLEESLKQRYTHVFGNICYNPAALIDDFERKMKVFLQVGDWNEGIAARGVESSPKINPLVQVSYNLNVLVNNIQYLLMRILENGNDAFESETLKTIAPFLDNLKKATTLSCSSSFEIMYTEFSAYILTDQLDLLLDQGLMLIKSLHNERKKLVESLSHIRSVLETFADQCIFFFIQLLQQQQQRQLATLEEQYSVTVKTRVHLDQIHLLETLARENLVRHFRHDDEINEQLDWFNQLAQFLIQGWSQASRILRLFASPIANNHQSTSKRLRYSYAFKLLNEEGQQILLFLQQTIGQLKEKYPRMELLNDEPVIVYLIRLTKLLRYELMRMSTTNLKQLKSDLNSADRLTLRATLAQVKSTTDEWNKETELLLIQRKKIKEGWVRRLADEYFGRVRTIEERNKIMEKDYQLECRQVEERIQKTQTNSITILRDVKLIGAILHEAKFKSNEIDIFDTDKLTSDVVQMVRQLIKIQQTIPQRCRFDNEQESKDLMCMICVDSVRIEVVKVEYNHDKPEDKQRHRDMWDNKIELSREGHDTESVSGIPKPLKSYTISNYVEDLFYAFRRTTDRHQF